MRTASLALAAVVWTSLFATDLSAQPILNRIELIVRDQIGAVRNPPAEQTESGYLGLIADDSQDEGRGVRVLDVAQGGPASKAGLQAGDLITSIGGQAVRSMDDMGRAMQGQPSGTKLVIKVSRNGTDRQQEVTLGQRSSGQPIGRANEDLPGPGQPAASAAPSGPRLGLRTLPVSDEARKQNNLPDSSGAMVVAITPGSPAEKAGVPMGAVVVALDGKPIAAPQDLAAAVRAAARPQIELTYLHEGEAVRKTVQLAAATAPADAPKLELRGRPVAGAPQPLPAPGPTLGNPEPAPTAALEARIRELEARIEKLEAALARDAK